MIKSKHLFHNPDKYVNPDKVLLWELTRKEVRESLEKGSIKAAILPTGSTEQHNEHLALCTDFAMATMISQQVALRSYPNAIVSTPCPVGYAPYHMGRKGTLTLRKETFQAYVFDVLESLTAHGINTILVVNGHAGNHAPIQDMLSNWRTDLGITLDLVSYWQVLSDEDLNQYVPTHKKYRAGVNHAAEFETSVVQAAWPERVRSVNMNQYDDAKLDYDKEADASFAKFYIRHFGKPYYGDGNENITDRTRQEQALCSNPENGLALISIATEKISKILDRMIRASESGGSWPE